MNETTVQAESVASLDRLARLSRTMEIVTVVGMAFIAGAMLAAFLIPDWTRNILPCDRCGWREGCPAWM